ncbi:MAG TPA: DUF1178 family protein [Spirochaetota bacterium]|nr:MAG: hypothetical protein BWY96_02063 [Spirochaetes bacterium ADurb.BinA120]HPI13461.1 DUF1178 family protein [Spirochaetota bacterium]HPO47078.1 DUF1178 family protein [Spirochaetota bacterium]HPV97595.1 DUF1178 family protein [Spirochaetota bacterium]
MISFDLECANEHRFEGVFKDYESFASQMERGLVACPYCESVEIKRLFSGCSIQARPATAPLSERRGPNMFEILRMIEGYVRENFENVGSDFAETARAIHYGAEEERNIYGQSTREEIDELLEEGISVTPLPSSGASEN